MFDVNVDVNQVVEQIKAIADPAVTHVLEVYARQAVSQGQVDVFVGYICLGITVLALVGTALAIWGETQISSNSKDSGAFLAIALVVFCFAVLAATVGVIHVITGNQEIANPEYYAIQQMIEQIKS